MTANTAVANSGKRYKFYTAFLYVITYRAFYLIYAAGMSASHPKSGHVRRNQGCPLWANSGHASIYSRPMSVLRMLSPSAFAD